jgi:Tfp pilus assembly protein PilZ
MKRQIAVFCRRNAGMRESQTKPEIYSIIPKLFRLINELSEDQQAMILKQISMGNLKKHLFKAIIDMTDVQQMNLLKQLESRAVNDTDVRTVSLDDDEEASMRGHRRKRCLLNVTYSSEGKQYKDYILDISSVGVFIETEETFNVGQQIVLNFTLPNYQQALKLDSSVAWIGHRGIGVKFKRLSPYQEEIIQSYIEKEERT